MVVKAIQINNVSDDMFVRNFASATQELNMFKDYFNQNVKNQLKVDNGMFLR